MKCPHCGKQIKQDKIPYKEIIGYLNKSVGRNYRHKTKKYRKCIRARWKEGMRLPDFKKVVDIKVKEWSNSEKMKKYLRPQTLFNNKMDWYLNQELDEVEEKEDYSEVEKFMNRKGDDIDTT